MRYVQVDPGTIAQVIGNSSLTSPGDYLHRLICTVTNAAASTVSLTDGATTPVDILPNNVTGGVGVYPVEVNMVSKSGKWAITTDAGVQVIAAGVFL